LNVSDEKLSPEAAVRLLRAKGAELEYVSAIGGRIGSLAADIALIAQLLADHIERSEPRTQPVIADVSGIPNEVDVVKPPRIKGEQ
jgi:hypothetical protein